MLAMHDNDVTGKLFGLMQVGPIDEMIESYETALSQFEEDDSVNEEAVSLRYEKVCRVV